MTDKEDHEYAAKAAGIEGAWDAGIESFIVNKPNGKKWEFWRPKTDDGDAFALMGACNLCIDYRVACVRTYDSAGKIRSIEEPIGTDPEAATRLAIFRAAVEIGRAMK